MYKELFSCLRAVACKNKPSFDLQQISEAEILLMYRLAKSHDLAHLLTPFLQSVSLPPEASAKLTKQQMLAVFRYEQQRVALEQASAIFEKEGICFMPLKGSVLRAYYPEPWMRTSCDIDILIKEEDMAKATVVLTEQLGYQMGEKSTHDLSFFSESGVHLELHFSLNEPDFLTANALQHAFDTAILQPNTQYQYALSHEMFCFYHIYHMAKHIMAGGCGIKPFLDLWIIRHKMGYDEAALQTLLQREGLLQFALIAARLSDVWFSGDAHDDLTARLEQYVLEGKAYGTEKHHETVRQAKEGGKWQHMRSRIFLDYDSMQKSYPSLSRCPLLFPFYQVRRWGAILFTQRRKKALRELSLNAKISREEAAEAAAFLADIGL